jgi:hypothetical protein
MKEQCNLYLEERVQRIGREDAAAAGMKFSKLVSLLILDNRKERLAKLGEAEKNLLKEDNDGIK